MFLSLPKLLHSSQLIRSSLCSFAMGATGYRCASAFSNPLTLLSQGTTSELAFLHESLSFSAHDVVYVLLRPCLFPFTILPFRASGGRHEIYRQVSSTSFRMVFSSTINSTFNSTISLRSFLLLQSSTLQYSRRDDPTEDTLAAPHRSPY